MIVYFDNFNFAVADIPADVELNKFRFAPDFILKPDQSSFQSLKTFPIHYLVNITLLTHN